MYDYVVSYDCLRYDVTLSRYQGYAYLFYELGYFLGVSSYLFSILSRLFYAGCKGLFLVDVGGVSPSRRVLLSLYGEG